MLCLALIVSSTDVCIKEVLNGFSETLLTHAQFIKAGNKNNGNSEGKRYSDGATCTCTCVCRLGSDKVSPSLVHPQTVGHVHVHTCTVHETQLHVHCYE